MGVQKNGLAYTKELTDPVESDYIWYRACVINGYNMHPTPTGEELRKQLSHLSQHDKSQEYMRKYDSRDKTPLNFERFIKTLHADFERDCLKIDYFDWIDDSNRRLIYFIWKLLGHSTFQTVNDQSILIDYVLNPQIQFNNFKQIVFMEGPCPKNKLVLIHCINRLNTYRETKINILENIKWRANSTLSSQEVIKWLSTDSNIKIDWAYNYLNNLYPQNLQLAFHRSKSIEPDIISFLDITHTLNVDRFKLIMISMKKAWSQSRYREKNKGKKQYSINMSNDIASILDEISLKRNINKNDLVESLIRAEYENCNASNVSPKGKCTVEGFLGKIN